MTMENEDEDCSKCGKNTWKLFWKGDVLFAKCLGYGCENELKVGDIEATYP